MVPQVYKVASSFSNYLHSQFEANGLQPGPKLCQGMVGGWQCGGLAGVWRLGNRSWVTGGLGRGGAAGGKPPVLFPLKDFMKGFLYVGLVFQGWGYKGHTVVLAPAVSCNSLQTSVSSSSEWGRQRLAIQRSYVVQLWDWGSGKFGKTKGLPCQDTKGGRALDLHPFLFTQHPHKLSHRQLIRGTEFSFYQGNAHVSHHWHHHPS